MKEDITIERRKYDDSGNIIEFSYYGPDEKLKIIKQNDCAILRMKYDDSGNIVEESHFGTDEKLRELIHGMAIIRFIYNEKNEKIKTIALDKNKKIIYEE